MKSNKRKSTQKYKNSEIDLKKMLSYIANQDLSKIKKEKLKKLEKHSKKIYLILSLQNQN